MIEKVTQNILAVSLVIIFYKSKSQSSSQNLTKVVGINTETDEECMLPLCHTTITMCTDTP